MRLTAYTDGSACTGGYKLGGWGCYIKSTPTIKMRKGYANTKTGRMELTAVIYCLRTIKNKNIKLTIYSDSMYVCNTVNEWIEKWALLGFVDKANIDLLEQLHHELMLFKHRVRLVHIKGHQRVTDESSDHVLGNKEADRLADYKTQKNYQVDIPIEMDDLMEIEKQDYYFKKDKWYLKDELVR